LELFTERRRENFRRTGVQDSSGGFQGGGKLTTKGNMGDGVCLKKRDGRGGRKLSVKTLTEKRHTSDHWE